MSNHDYTVVIPAYNAEKYIAETLQSVLAQTVPPQQVIVVDDGSVDATAQIAGNFSSIVKVISTPNRGAGAATTTGVAAVQTAIIAFVDSDDLWRPKKMETQLAILNDSEQKSDAVLSRMQAFGDIQHKNIKEEYSAWSRSTLVVWTHAFRKIGDVRDMGHGYGEMIDWFSRAKNLGIKFIIVEEPLANRRIHRDSLSYNANAKSGQAQDFLKIAMLAYQRKKQIKIS